MPISVPPYMPIAPRQRPNIDIAGSIGGLGDALIGGLEYGQKRKIDRATREAFAGGIPMGPGGVPDYNTMAARMLQLGNMDAGLALTRLAEVQSQNAWERSRPDWQMVGGSLYDLNALSPGGGGGAGTVPSAGGGQPAYPPSDSGGQPAPDLGGGGGYPPEPEPEQQVAAGPEPVIRGPEPQRPRRRGLNAAGQEIDQEWSGSEWVDVSGPKAVTRQQKPPTIDAMRSQQLLKVIEPELATLETTFADLAKPENQAGALVPGNLSNYAVTPGYQRAKQALGTIAQSYLYSLSGATAPIEEVNKLVDSMMPRIGEDATTIADKRARIRTMVDSIRTRAGGGAAAEGEVPPDEQIAGPAANGLPPGWTQEEWDVLTPEEQQSISQ